MASPKSPFLVFRDFLSPKQCEHVVYGLNIFEPDRDKDGKPIKMLRTHEESESMIFDRFTSIKDKIEKHYNYVHRGTEYVTFEYYPAGVNGPPQSESSNYTRKKKWVRTRDRDISAILFLSTYQDQIPFDSDFEVYGGKLEFPQHGFGFNPERGTLIVFPSGPHFINAIANVVVGDLYLARFHVAADVPYIYQPANFPGDYRSWFKGLE